MSSPSWASFNTPCSSFLQLKWKTKCPSWIRCLLMSVPHQYPDLYRGDWLFNCTPPNKSGKDNRRGSSPKTTNSIKAKKLPLCYRLGVTKNTHIMSKYRPKLSGIQTKIDLNSLRQLMLTNAFLYLQDDPEFDQVWLIVDKSWLTHLSSLVTRTHSLPRNNVSFYRTTLGK